MIAGNTAVINLNSDVLGIIGSLEEALADPQTACTIAIEGDGAVAYDLAGNTAAATASPVSMTSYTPAP